MLQLAQRTSAPSATSVSMRTAVWIVMCSEPEIRRPSGACSRVLLAERHEAGHLVLGERISLRPNGARSRSATRKSLVLARRDRAVSDMGTLLRVEQFERTPQPLRRRSSPNRAGALRRRSNQPGDSVHLVYRSSRSPSVGGGVFASGEHDDVHVEQVVDRAVRRCMPSPRGHRRHSCRTCTNDMLATTSPREKFTFELSPAVRVHRHHIEGTICSRRPSATGTEAASRPPPGSRSWPAGADPVRSMALRSPHLRSRGSATTESTKASKLHSSSLPCCSGASPNSGSRVSKARNGASSGTTRPRFVSALMSLLEVSKDIDDEVKVTGVVEELDLPVCPTGTTAMFA